MYLKRRKIRPFSKLMVILIRSLIFWCIMSRLFFFDLFLIGLIPIIILLVIETRRWSKEEK